MPTFDASSPSPVYGDTVNNTSLVTSSFTPPTGSIVVAKVICGDAAQTSTTPTGLTFTSRTNTGTSGATTRSAIYTAVGAGAAVTVTAAFSGSTGTKGLVVEVWTNAQLAATPAVNGTLRSTFPTAPSATITTVAANSVVTWMCGDWSATDGTSRAYRSSATERTYRLLTGQYTLYAAYQTAAAAGSQTYGLTAPTQNWNLGAVEIQDIPAAFVARNRRVGKRQW